MKYRVGVPVSVVAAGVALAAPAAASEDEFVETMQTTYAFLTDQQLRSEGAKICSVLRSGTPASDAVVMVRNDLGVSISAAGEIVSAAVVELDC
ncbi:hypothetical protein BST36_11315 [Mycolicibacterium moriokaense]|uniref:DUF732 domain-containing protein n=1 Tax=Mycolicibacterium moriokaense TaxID=39691 RepID=A0AAD1HBS6_9MYCO|nr:DUF732 domain-containing protein [Mycolicibacterium moriokaense]MCV7038351.1 DUF732 domain-containing protein [Mycolicibacterium moriokaense]ORB24321.1 hypothetical protein BST36_11315 [Mycolicibacterium moriokaense]BBX02527.1 hypothetical protein MMOR_34630 [Mycolicibacterium moriokaense]